MNWLERMMARLRLSEPDSRSSGRVTTEADRRRYQRLAWVLSILAVGVFVAGVSSLANAESTVPRVLGWGSVVISCGVLGSAVLFAIGSRAPR